MADHVAEQIVKFKATTAPQPPTKPVLHRSISPISAALAVRNGAGSSRAMRTTDVYDTFVTHLRG
jgi:hypothetical protein